MQDHEKNLKAIVDDMTTKSKTSADEHNKKVTSFDKAAKKKRRIIAAETKVDVVHITPAVGQQIVLRFLGKKKQGHDAAVDIEIGTQK